MLGLGCISNLWTTTNQEIHFASCPLNLSCVLIYFFHLTDVGYQFDCATFYCAITGKWLFVQCEVPLHIALLFHSVDYFSQNATLSKFASTQLGLYWKLSRPQVPYLSACPESVVSWSLLLNVGYVELQMGVATIWTLPSIHMRELPMSCMISGGCSWGRWFMNDHVNDISHDCVLFVLSGTYCAMFQRHGMHTWGHGALQDWARSLNFWHHCRSVLLSVCIGAWISAYESKAACSSSVFSAILLVLILFLTKPKPLQKNHQSNKLKKNWISKTKFWI